MKSKTFSTDVAALPKRDERHESEVIEYDAMGLPKRDGTKPSRLGSHRFLSYFQRIRALAV